MDVQVLDEEGDASEGPGGGRGLAGMVIQFLRHEIECRVGRFGASDCGFQQFGGADGAAGDGLRLADGVEI